MTTPNASVLLQPRLTSTGAAAPAANPAALKASRDLAIKADILSTITRTFEGLRTGLAASDKKVNASTAVNPLTNRRYTREEILSLFTPEQIASMAAVKVKAQELLALFAPPAPEPAPAEPQNEGE